MLPNDAGKSQILSAAGGIMACRNGAAGGLFAERAKVGDGGEAQRAEVVAALQEGDDAAVGDVADEAGHFGEVLGLQELVAQGV